MISVIVGILFVLYFHLSSKISTLNIALRVHKASCDWRTVKPGK